MRHASAILVAAGLLAFPAAAVERPVVRLRVGLVAFSAPGTSGQSASAAPSSTEQLERYLEKVSEASLSAPPPAPIYQFDTYIGNYYQVLSWLRNGDLDAAFVSAFTAMVLVDVDQLNIRRVLEVAPYDPATGGAAEGHQSLIAAHRHGVPSANAVKEFDRYIDLVWKASEPGREPLDIDALNDYDVLLVTHLSTTGFIAPIAYAERRLLHLRTMFPDAADHDRLGRFWASSSATCGCRCGTAPPRCPVTARRFSSRTAASRGSG